MTETPIERRVLQGLMAVFGASAILAALLRPDFVRLRPLTAGEFVQVVAPLFLVALFIERVLEVFLTTWRAAESKRLALAAAATEKDAAARDAAARLADYKSQTQRIAFMAGTAIGALVAALGIRILEQLADPGTVGRMGAAQKGLFIAVDVLFSGAVLGGGSEALHKLVKVFTDFMDTTAALARKRGGEPGG